MPTLNEVAFETKSIFKWGAIGLACIFLLYLLVRGGFAIKDALYPTKPAPPTVAYGKLPPIQFPTSKNDGNYSYSIDTLTGILPNFSDRVKIFKMIPPEADLLALKNTQETVGKIGFISQPVKISKDIYQWGDNGKIARTLTYNLLTDDFSLTTSYLTDPNVLKANNLPNTDDAKDLSKSFLDNLGSFPNDIDTTKTKTSLLSISNGTLFQTTSLSSAQVIQVYFFQADIDKTPIYYPDPNTSTMTVAVAGGETLPQIVNANFFHQTVSDSSETYPLKTAQEAFDELKSGGGYIGAYDGNKKDISITNVFLAYYIGETEQNYLMPIIVFEGQDNFIAYVSAVKDEWLSN